MQQLANQLLAHVAEPDKADKKPSFVDQVKGLFGKRTTTETNSPSQQLIAWVQQNNVQALYQWASDSNLAETLRISAIEGLGQISLEHANDVVERLTTLQQNDSDPDIQRTAFSTLRRYQRRMIPKTPKHSTINLNTV